MRVYRLHLPQLQPGPTTVQGPEAQHLVQVLRVKPGAKVRAFDGRGLEAEGRVVWLGEGELGLELDGPAPSTRESERRLTLAVALLKGDKLADVVRMGTELGVVAFQPFTSSRADVPVLSPSKLTRLRRVAQESAKQSLRSVVPDVHGAVPLSVLALSGLALVAHPEAERTLQEALANAPQDAGADITVVTGPEGGFSEAEVWALQAAGALTVRLGARVLRAETAPVALAAALLVPEAW